MHLLRTIGLTSCAVLVVAASASAQGSASAAASSGESLLDGEGGQILREQLLPRVDLLTPNRQEAEALLGRTIVEPAEIEQAQKDLKNVIENMTGPAAEGLRASAAQMGVSPEQMFVQLAKAAQDAAKQMAWREERGGSVPVGANATTNTDHCPSGLAVAPR